MHNDIFFTLFLVITLTIITLAIALVMAAESQHNPPPPTTVNDNLLDVLQSLTQTYKLTPASPLKETLSHVAVNERFAITLSQSSNQSSHDYVLKIQINNCAQDIRLELKSASSYMITEVQPTGDPSFDERISVLKHPNPDQSIALLNAQTRAALLAFTQHASFSLSGLSRGTLVAQISIRPPDFSAPFCATFIQDALALADRLASIHHPCETLLNTIFNETTAPDLHTLAFRTLLTHPQATPPQRERALTFALHNPSAPTEMHILALTSLGSSGYPKMKAMLSDLKDLKECTKVFNLLLEHLPKDELVSLVASSWNRWLVITNTPFATTTLLALKRVPGPRPHPPPRPTPPLPRSPHIRPPLPNHRHPTRPQRCDRTSTPPLPPPRTRRPPPQPHANPQKARTNLHTHSPQYPP